MKTFQRFMEEVDDDTDKDKSIDMRPAKGGKIIFKSALDSYTHGQAWRGTGVPDTLKQFFTAAELLKFTRTNVALVPDSDQTAHLGAPVKWIAPNGVVVCYARGQRRNDNNPGDATNFQTPNWTHGSGGAGAYHDFNPGEEVIIAATRNDGPARRALRAWADVFLTNKVTTRMQARQMVRPGD